MNRTEHLLVILMEECNEVSQRCSKALRFGLKEAQANEDNNARRIEAEFADLIGVYKLLMRARAVKRIDDERVGEKMRKVEKYLTYSKECGTLKP